MLYWIPYPFIRITASFAGGILLNYYIDLPVGILLGMSGTAFALYLITWITCKKIRFHNLNLIISFLAFSCMFFSGSLCIHYRIFSSNKNHISHLKMDVNHYLAQVSEVVDSSGRFDKILVRIQQIRHDTSWVMATGKVILYMQWSGEVKYGDILLIKGKPDRIKPPLNPDEFDYRKYMRNKGILFHHFIKSQDFMVVDQMPGSFLFRISKNARKGITRIIYRSFKDEAARGIMLALLTGQREFIDQETYDHFIDIGIIHVLAVSGLHVGIIYMFLLVLFRPFNKNRWGKKISLFAKILVLLFFAFLTGLSPSVLRATLMFSTMIAGKIMNRNSHILNSVFLSACLLLSINPFLLFDVGFQLSYSAVIGILLFQPLIYRNRKCKIKAVDWVWQLTSVSIAAQLGTFSLTLLYFKQFPTYFLLGNIIAIPYVTVSITGGLFFLIISPIQQIASITAWLLQVITEVFIILISSMQHLPMGKIAPININTYQSILLFILILSVFFIFRKRNWKIIFISLISAGGIILVDLYQCLKLQNENKIIVYHIPNYACIELVDQRKGIMLVQNLSKNLKSRIDYHTGNLRIIERRNTIVYEYAGFAANFPSYYKDGILLFVWNGSSIVIIHDKFNFVALRSVRIDYMIVSGNKLEIRDFLNMNLNVKHVIWDASNSLIQLDSDSLLNRDEMHHVRIHGPYIKPIQDQ
jgi:competence protein ComEC